MNKLLVIGLILLLFGCTQIPKISFKAQNLSDLPDLSIEGMPELGSVPSTNITVNIKGFSVQTNPFPDRPSFN